jgi:acyl phosphate:glycerol-3-phosphate acyltransferase
MQPLLALSAVLSGYLLGSVSFSRLVSRLLAPGVDISSIELRNSKTPEPMRCDLVSATSVSMHLGARAGCLAAGLDMAKLALPTLLWRLLLPGEPYAVLCATAGMLGHVWPVFYRFRGGRGLSAIYGGLLGLDWPGALITATVGMVFGMFVVRQVFLAYLAGVWLIVPWLWLRTHSLIHVGYGLAANAVFIIAMLPDIRVMRRRRREGKAADFAEAMQMTPMGRGLYRIACRTGAIKSKPSPGA